MCPVVNGKLATMQVAHGLDVRSDAMVEHRPFAALAHKSHHLNRVSVRMYHDGAHVVVRVRGKDGSLSGGQLDLHQARGVRVARVLDVEGRTTGVEPQRGAV